MTSLLFYITTSRTTHVARTNLAGPNAMCDAVLKVGQDWTTTKPAERRICGRCKSAMTFNPVSRGARA